MTYPIVPVSPGSRGGMRQVEDLLDREGIRLDPHLDYTCAMLDGQDRIIATGSCFGNTLRCIAVSSARQGEGLLGPLLTHLVQTQYARGNYHLFLYTKCQTAGLFRDFGFYEIARVEGTLSFLENRKNGFTGFLEKLSAARRPGRSAAIVMNANPFTLGHQYLAERAAAENDTVHLFILSEDAGEVPFAARRRLAREGTAHLPNVICHDSGPYIVSRATFPSYFLKDSSAAAESQARLDLAVFSRIARALDVTRRYVGEEPYSPVTSLYNRVMLAQLPEMGIGCAVIPRRSRNGRAISASEVRRLWREGRADEWAEMVPPSTQAYLRSVTAGERKK